MKYYSTKNQKLKVSFREAVLKGLPPDNGLYMPEEIPRLPDTFYKELNHYSFREIALTVARLFIGNEIEESALKKIIEQSVYFPAPVITLSSNRYYQELFHGPSLAFKDFGAGFMAQVMQYFLSQKDQETTILVATSGDTGAAVATGFYNVPNVRVFILYPSGKVSQLQELQLTTWGNNITAIEVNGVFDDCQALVKEAFLDEYLNKHINLSAANSINIARLIPQSFYYFEGYKQLEDQTKPTAFVVPSGNFGNLTAGLFAKKMGLPVSQFIAATNKNDTFPQYLKTGKFSPRASETTISNAMDVGNPSNFSRITDLYCSTWNNITADIKAYSITEEETIKTIQDTYTYYNYTADPHGAVGIAALNKFLTQNPKYRGVVLGTAHPAKFLKEMTGIIDKNNIDIPSNLLFFKNKQKQSIKIEPMFKELKKLLLNMHNF